MRQRQLSIFGGTAEYVGTWLKVKGHESWFFMRDTRHQHRFDAT